MLGLKLTLDKWELASVWNGVNRQLAGNFMNSNSAMLCEHKREQVWSTLGTADRSVMHFHESSRIAYLNIQEDVKGN